MSGKLKIFNVSSRSAVFPLATWSRLHTCVLHRRTTVTFTPWLNKQADFKDDDKNGAAERGCCEIRSLSSVAELRSVPLQKTRTPIWAQTIQSARNRRAAAASLQEMHSGSFALLSNRVNEPDLPTICSSPKESATDKRSLCNGWTCRKGGFAPRLLQRVVELGGRWAF